MKTLFTPEQEQELQTIWESPETQAVFSSSPAHHNYTFEEFCFAVAVVDPSPDVVGKDGKIIDSNLEI